MYILVIIVLFIIVYHVFVRDKGGQNYGSSAPPAPAAPPSASSRSSGRIMAPPHDDNLLYPAALIRFADLAEGEHDDPRALYYVIRHFDPHGKRPFTVRDLDAGDFKNGTEARRYLLRRRYIHEIDPAQSLALLYSKDELKDLLREHSLPVGGRKDELADRLAQSGFRSADRRPSRKLYELTDAGRGLIERQNGDRQAAILAATRAIMHSDYPGAISAYREYDAVWGFSHASGKNHTIFAHYDFPFSRFDFIAGYAMTELHNSAEFKCALRAVLIAGLMRGEQERVELAYCFRDVCQEPIQCPNIARYFSMDDFDRHTGAIIRSSMERRAEIDGDTALEYYISRVLYLSRQA